MSGHLAVVVPIAGSSALCTSDSAFARLARSAMRLPGACQLTVTLRPSFVNQSTASSASSQCRGTSARSPPTGYRQQLRLAAKRMAQTLASTPPAPPGRGSVGRRFRHGRFDPEGLPHAPLCPRAWPRHSESCAPCLSLVERRTLERCCRGLGRTNQTRTGHLQPRRGRLPER